MANIKSANCISETNLPNISLANKSSCMVATTDLNKLKKLQIDEMRKRTLLQMNHNKQLLVYTLTATDCDIITMRTSSY